MKTNILIFLGVLSLFGAGAWLWAADPLGAERGKLLLLENDHVLEGDIEHVGTQYRVRHSLGETWVPGERVIGLCASAEDGYRLLQGRSNLADPDERLRLAQWCRERGLRQHAVEEVKAAVDLRPEHAETRRLLNSLLQSTTPTTVTPPLPRPEPTPLPPVDVSADSVNRFVTHVQPILMNACASCHANGNGGNFHLYRVYGVGGNRKMLQHNVAAVIAQINFRDQPLSPLLIKAVSTHSDTMARAPLKDRQAPAFRTLQDWVRQTALSNPHLVPRPTEMVSGTTEVKTVVAETPAASPVPITTPPQSSPPPTSGSATGPLVPAPAEEPKPLDVVDPELFNRENHPPAPGTPGR